MTPEAKEARHRRAGHTLLVHPSDESGISDGGSGHLRRWVLELRRRGRG